jgi:hypothetical protein
LKPGFFKNEQLCDLSPWHRLCFAGVWLCADRDGRVEDRPKRLKAEIFPYDDLDMNSLLWDLMHAGFIVRYAAVTQPLIWIPSWDSHQFPRSDEAVSKWSPYAPGMERTPEPDRTTFPATRPDDRVEPLANVGLLVTETDPSLGSDGPVSPQQIGDGRLDLGDGRLDLGDGRLDLGDGTCAETAARGPRARDLLDLWNATMKPPIPKCREFTEELRRKVRARLDKRPSLAEWREIFEEIQRNSFCCGEGSSGWKATFFWIMRNDNNGAQKLDEARARLQAPAVTVRGQHNAAAMQAAIERIQGRQV